MTDPYGEDDDPEERPKRRSGFWSILAGIFWGVVLIGIGLVALNEYLPPPGSDTTAPGAERDTTGGTAQIQGRPGASDGQAGDSRADAPAGDVAPSDDDEEAGTPGAGSESDVSEADASARIRSGASDDAPSEGSSGSTDAGPKDEPTPSDPGKLPKPQISLTGPAIKVNARPFAIPGGTGLLAVVLYGGTSDRLLDQALGGISMPLTLAVDPHGTNVVDLARSASGRGFEILVELPLAVEGAGSGRNLTSADGGQRLQERTVEILSSLNMAVGAVAPDGAKMLYDLDAMAALLKPIVAHSFLWVEPRVSSSSAAARLAVESKLIFVQGSTYVDAGSTADEIYWDLDAAAKQARTSGTAIIFIEAKPDALRTLVRWGFEKVASDVVLAPISAIVRKRGQD